MITYEPWREQYKRSGHKEYVKMTEYVPCPGSVKCGVATTRAKDDPPLDDGPTWPNARI